MSLGESCHVKLPGEKIVSHVLSVHTNNPLHAVREGALESFTVFRYLLRCSNLIHQRSIELNNGIHSDNDIRRHHVPVPPRRLGMCLYLQVRDDSGSILVCLGFSAQITGQGLSFCESREDGFLDFHGVFSETHVS
jgi:hypothetical protein